VPGSAVIRVLGSGVLNYAGRVYSGKKPYPYPEPFVPGSASIGRVAAVGPDATTLKPGRLVIFDSFVTGRDNPDSLILHGLSSRFNPGSKKLMEGEWRDGTYAEYVKVCIVPVPPCPLK
jgi:NADPH:quinone reductase-like Zn-dependent oxidoreductase